MIDRLIDEIYVSMNNNCFLTALTTALSIPDICGKAEYPNLKPAERYVKWFDTFIGDYEKSPSSTDEQPYMNGELICSLRNNALHEATYNIDQKKNDIQEFNLLIQNPNRAKISGASAGVVYHYMDGEEIRGNRRINISVIDLILKICLCGRTYYNKNKDKFNFMENKIMTIDDSMRNMIINKEILTYEKVFTLDKEKTHLGWDSLYLNK